MLPAHMIWISASASERAQFLLDQFAKWRWSAVRPSGSADSPLETSLRF